MTGHLPRSCAIAVCLLLLGVVNPLTASADAGDPGGQAPSSAPATASSSAVPSDFGLTVSPARLVIGQSDTAAQEIRLINTGTVRQTVTVQKRNFSTGNDGALNFQQNAQYSAAEWITVTPASVDIAPGATRVVTATIAMPAHPEPGDHQVALVFLAAGEGNGNITVNKGIGIPAYITVPGPIDDSVTIHELTAPGFVGGGDPLALTASLHNTGTVHRDFRGDTALGIEGADGAARFADFTVPRGTDRTVTATWDPPLIGIFHPTITFTNADGSVQTASVRVIVFPVVPALVLVGALLVLGSLMLLARRGYLASVRKAGALQAVAGGGDG